MWTQIKQTTVKLIQWIRARGLVVPSSISAAIVGFIMFMLYPIKQRVFDYVWPPRPTIRNELVSIHKPVLRGDKFVVRLHLVAEPGKNLPRGMIEVRTQGNQIENKSSSLVDIDGNESSKDIEFDFVARSAGVAKMDYEYVSNQKPVAVAPVELTISDSPVGCIPRVEDISGCWQVQWDKSFGNLVLQVGEHGSLTGTFELLDGENGRSSKGTVAGYSNGMNVYLVLNTVDPGKAPSRNSVATLLVVPDNDRIVMCGTMSNAGPKPFVTGGIWSADAPEAKVCGTANFTAFARSQ